jgi:hypothetical protein
MYYWASKGSSEEEEKKAPRRRSFSQQKIGLPKSTYQWACFEKKDDR